MVLRLKRPSHSPSPFSWNSLTAPRYNTPPTEAHVAELPSPPTSWLSARDMKIFGVEPLRSDLGVIRCGDCDKPVLRSAISDHAINCSDIRSGKKWVKNKSADGEVELKKGKKRGVDGEEGDDPSEPSKKKIKTTKGRTKGPVDYDKQCGVINDKGFPCSRSLTCKAHSMGAKRAVQGRSKAYDELLLEWNRANNPNWVEPVKKETKAEKKERREKEKAEKKRLAVEAAIASGMDPNKAATKKAPKKAQAPTTASRLEGDDAAENLDDLDSEAEVDSLVKAVQEAQLKGIAGVPLAVPNSESSWFVVRRERLRNCRDLLASALASGAARGGVTGGVTGGHQPPHSEADDTQMVHVRINEREPNPNPFVNFTTVLPMGDSTVEEAARQLLRALAAQVKPVMKAHGFVVNSLEEYEYNSVFAGRNWNHGETIELVLRSSTGSLLSTHWLMSTLCHELAHIKHMNHGSAFQALWRQLQQEVRALQSKGYYGDGYWSSGTRLVDSAKIAGEGIEMGELPEYMCGGAHLRARPVSRRPYKPKGLQTSKKRKAGTRVNSSAFNTIGKPLNENLEGESKSHGIGFRKKAGSKRAREERALAAEQRIQTLEGKASSSNLPTPPVTRDDMESEDEERDSETDHDRRRTLLEVIEEKDLDALRATMFDPTQEFILPSTGSSGGRRDACSVEDPRDATSTIGGVSGPAFGGLSRIKTSPPAIQPRKKQKTSQLKLMFTSHTTAAVAEAMNVGRGEPWDCIVCTLTNEPNYLACSACGTERGESKWVGGSRAPL